MEKPKKRKNLAKNYAVDESFLYWLKKKKNTKPQKHCIKTCKWSVKNKQRKKHWKNVQKDSGVNAA